MKIRFSRTRVVLACAAACLSPLLAHAQSGVLQETVVTATRTEQPLADLLADVSIVDSATIARSGATGLADVLARVAGVEISRNGGPGTTTSVFLRGGETRFTAVYIDGVRVDSQSTGGASWQAIPLAQIDRIEVLRGPAAAVYGSDAIAGVIQIFTKKGEGGFTPSVGVGFGTYGTRRVEASVSGAQGLFDYSLGLSRDKSEGFNARPVAGQNPDKDGYVAESASARVGLQISSAHRLEASLLSGHTEAQYDSGLTGDARSRNAVKTAALQWNARWTDAYSTRVQVTDSEDRYQTFPSPYLSTTNLRGYLFQNELKLGQHGLTAALERREDKLDNAPLRRERSQDALALGYNLRAGAHTVQANARYDNDSEFGGEGTGSAAYGYGFAPGWRATASVGTAFRAPTLYQRFSEYGNPALQPESARNAEVGVRYAQGGTSFGVVAYRNKISNLITYIGGPGPCVSAFGCYYNVARAQLEGLTFTAAHRMAGVTLSASLDLQDPRDLATGNRLARRSKQHGTLAAETRLGAWSLGADVQLSGDRFENAANTQVLPGYGLLNLNASTTVARDWTFLARLDNAGDKQYQLARTYATPGRQLYVGLKWSPQP